MSHVSENCSKISPNYHCIHLATKNFFSPVFCLKVLVFIVIKAFFIVLPKTPNHMPGLSQTSSNTNHYFSLRSQGDNLHVISGRVFFLIIVSVNEHLFTWVYSIECFDSMDLSIH